MEQILGACGLTCGTCPAFLATQANDAAAIARVAEQWKQEYGAEFSPEMIWCDGCMESGARKCSHCAECEIRACARGRNLRHCAQCDEYGCPTITGFFAMVPPAKATLDALRGR